LLVPWVAKPRLPGEKPISAGAVVAERFTRVVLVMDRVAEEISVLTGEETIDVSSVLMGTDDEIIPLIGEETIKVSSVMEGIDEEITPLTGDETIKVSSVMEGIDEELTATDGGSDEKTSEINCTDLEKLSFGGEFEKMLTGTTLGSC
jgi:hypothetical protein